MLATVTAREHQRCHEEDPLKHRDDYPSPFLINPSMLFGEDSRFFKGQFKMRQAGFRWGT